MRLRASFIAPCLPSAAKQPPAGPSWLHEIKHDGFRSIARRDAAGVRLFTRNGHDFTIRFPRIAAAASPVTLYGLADARARALDAGRKRRRAERARQRLDAAKAITFKQCSESYIAAHRAGWRNDKHAAQWSRRFLPMQTR
jgi:ATP-dependent DNA ligase